MDKSQLKTGYFKNNVPYVRVPGGHNNLVIFDGLNFDHKPLSGLTLRMSIGWAKRLTTEYTVYLVNRKPGLPAGYSMQDMSNDYATMIREEFEGPVDVMGISTGGPIAQYFAVDHPDLVHHLVLAMTGYRLTEEGRKLQKHVGDLARQRKWREAYASLITGVYPKGIKKYIFKLMMWLFGAFSSPDDPSDGLVEIEAEDRHDFKDKLAEIHVPTLVIGGDEDFFYPVSETAAGIPNAKLILYKGYGHDIIFNNSRQFGEDLLAFLRD